MSDWKRVFWTAEQVATLAAALGEGATLEAIEVTNEQGYPTVQLQVLHEDRVAADQTGFPCPPCCDNDPHRPIWCP